MDQPGYVRKVLELNGFRTVGIDYAIRFSVLVGLGNCLRAIDRRLFGRANADAITIAIIFAGAIIIANASAGRQCN